MLILVPLILFVKVSVCPWPVFNKASGLISLYSVVPGHWSIIQVDTFGLILRSPERVQHWKFMQGEKNMWKCSANSLFSQSQALGVFFFLFFCKFAKWQEDFSGCGKQIVPLAQVEGGWDTDCWVRNMPKVQTWYFHFNFSGLNRMTEAFYRIIVLALYVGRSVFNQVGSLSLAVQYFKRKKWYSRPKCGDRSIFLSTET